MARLSKGKIHWSRVLFAVILSFFVVEIALAFERKIMLAHDIHQRLMKTRVELENLQNRNFELRVEKEALYRPEKIEQLAREKLGLTKPNEIAVKIIQKSPPESNLEQGKTYDSYKRLWEKIRRILIHNGS